MRRPLGFRAAFMLLEDHSRESTARLGAVFSQQFGDPGLRSLAPCHPHDEIIKVCFRNPNLDAIQFKKNKSGHRSNPLVAIHEWMVLDDVENVCSSHLDEVDMEVLSRRPSTRHGEGRTQERFIADPRTATVPLDLVPVDLHDLVESKEAWLHRLLGQPLEGFPIAMIDLHEGFLERLATLRAAHG